MSSAPRLRLLAGLMVVSAWACGPGVSINDVDGGTDPTHDSSPPPPDTWHAPTGRITGRVWAPGQAPGMVPDGQEIPVFGAQVFVTTQNPAVAYAIPQEAYCDQCQDLPNGAAVTGTDGSFDLAGILPGTYSLVIRKAQFQLAQQVTVDANQTIDLPPEATTLPSEHNPAQGKWIPRIALAEGLWDNIEDILGKMGLGQVDGTGNFVCTSAAGHWDLYLNPGVDCSSADGALGTLEELVSDLNLMKQYHMIFVPCSNGSNTALFTNPVIRQNIYEYVKAGGKFYVTDWSAEWEDAVFPQFLVFPPDIDTASPDGPFGSGNGFSGDPNTTRAADQNLHDWLDNQVGPLVQGWNYTVGTVDADNFQIEGNYDRIEQTPGIQIGVDNDNLPIIETAKAWVMGDWGDGSGEHPATVTFEPIGCGRVLYSSYHTADSDHQGLLPQERVLLYLIMEIGSCKSGPIVQ